MNGLKELYGVTSDFRMVHRYTLKNKKGMIARFLDFGAIWESMLVPDKDGELRDVVLGQRDICGYEVNGDMLGAYVGRVANRTEGGRFTLDGKVYQMEINDGVNNLHTSSAKGFHKQIWGVLSHTESELVLSYHSPDGECGMPGNMNVRLTYSLSDEGELGILSEVECDERSIVNLTHHAYFNLNGCGVANCREKCEEEDEIFRKVTTCWDTELQIEADSYTPIREGGIPTGKIAPVEGTPFDFRQAKKIGSDFFAGHEQQLLVNGGYDHNFVIRGEGRTFRKAAEAYSAESGIRMQVFHDQPGLQFYSGNWLNIHNAKGDVCIRRYSGFCLETHGFTNAINTPGFPSPIIEADELYTTRTVYRFE